MSKKRKKSKEFLIKEMNLLPGDEVTFTLNCNEFMHLRLFGELRPVYKCSFPEDFKPTKEDLRLSTELQKHFYCREDVFEHWNDFINSLDAKNAKS